MANLGPPQASSSSFRSAPWPPSPADVPTRDTYSEAPATGASLVGYHYVYSRPESSIYLPSASEQAQDTNMRAARYPSGAYTHQHTAQLPVGAYAVIRVDPTTADQAIHHESPSIVTSVSLPSQPKCDVSQQSSSADVPLMRTLPRRGYCPSLPSYQSLFHTGHILDAPPDPPKQACVTPRRSGASPTAHPSFLVKPEIASPYAASARPTWHAQPSARTHHTPSSAACRQIDSRFGVSDPREMPVSYPRASATSTADENDADSGLWGEWMTDEFVQTTADGEPTCQASTTSDEFPSETPNLDMPKGRKGDFLHMLNTNLLAEHEARFPHAPVTWAGRSRGAKRAVTSSGSEYARIAKRARIDAEAAVQSGAVNMASRSTTQPVTPASECTGHDREYRMDASNCLIGGTSHGASRQPLQAGMALGVGVGLVALAAKALVADTAPAIPPALKTVHHPIKAHHLLQWAPSSSQCPPSNIDARHIEIANFTPIHDMHQQGLRLYIRFFHDDVIMQGRLFTAADIDRAMSKISNRLLFIALVRRRYTALAQAEPLNMLDEILQEQYNHFEGVDLQGEPYERGRAHSGTDCLLSRSDWIDFIHTAYTPLDTLRKAVYRDEAIAFADQKTIVAAIGTLILLCSLAGRPVDVRELEFAYAADGLVEGEDQEWAVEQVEEMVERTGVEGLLVGGKADQTNKVDDE